MQSVERELKLLKQKIDLLIDGYQVLYMKLEQQGRALRRLETALDEDLDVDDADVAKVVRLSDRFLARVRRNAADLDPDDKTLA